MAQAAERTQETRRGSSPLVTNRDRTTIEDAVVSSIVSDAAVMEASGAEPEVAGRSASIPGDSSPTVGESFSRVTGSRGTRGISVEVGEEEAAVDVTVGVLYGRPIPDVTKSMRARHDIRRVENMIGLRATKVNITVKDVIVPQQ